MATTTNLGLKKPAYTDAADVADINDNMDIIDQFAGSANEAIANLQDGIAIVANGNTHAAIPANYFVYVKGHGTLSDGLYKNTSGSTIAANATLSSSNLTADTDGGLNTLYNNITNKLNCVDKTTGSGKTFTITFDGYGAGYNAYIFGRFGYDSTKLSSAIVSHGSSGSAEIKCFGDETATVSCSGDVVTVTTQNNYAAVTVISSKAIT